MQFRASSHFRIEESQAITSPLRIRSQPKTELSLERRKAIMKEYYWDNDETVEIENNYQIGPATQTGTPRALIPRKKASKAIFPQEQRRYRKLGLFDTPSPVGKQKRLRKVMSDSKLERLSGSHSVYFVSQGVQLKRDIKRELLVSARETYDYESKRDFQSRNHQRESSQKVTLRERLKRQLLEDEQQINADKIKPNYRASADFGDNASSQLYSQLSQPGYDDVIQEQSRPRKGGFKMYQSQNELKESRPYEMLGIHTKSPAEHGFIEPQSSMSGLALGESNSQYQKQYVRKKTLNSRAGEGDDVSEKIKSSSIRAHLREQVMHAQKEAGRTKISRMPAQKLYDMNDSVNYAPYMLQQSQMGPQIASATSRVSHPENRIATEPVHMQVLESIQAMRRSSHSNSRISQHVPPPDIIFEHKPIPLVESPAQTTATAKPMNIVPRSEDEYGIQQVKLASSRKPTPEEMLNSTHLKRLISNGSSIKTPDFSQPSSLVQDPDGSKQLPLNSSNQLLQQVARHMLISMNNLQPGPPIGSSQRELSGALGPQGIAMPNLIVTSPSQANQNNLLLPPIQPSTQRLDPMSVAPMPIGVHGVVAEPPPQITQQLNEAMAGIFNQSQQKRSRNKQLMGGSNQPASTTSLQLTVNSDIPALHSTDRFRQMRKQMTPSNSNQSNQPSQLLQQSNVRSERSVLSHINNTSAEGNEQDFSEQSMETVEKLAEYLEILDLFGTNIVQFDHMVSETGKSDGLVNFYLYKRFLKEKKKLEDCVKGGPNIFNELDFLPITDSELNEFRQDQDNEDVLEMIQEQNRKGFESLNGIMEFFKTRFKIFPKANLNLEEDFEYETMYYLNKEVESLEAAGKDPKTPSKKRRQAHLRQVFLFEALFLIEFFNGLFVKEYEDYNQIEDPLNYLKNNRAAYSQSIGKYIIKRP